MSCEFVVDCFGDQIGLALIPARGARSRRHVAESHAPYLSPCDADATGKNALVPPQVLFVDAVTPEGERQKGAENARPRLRL